MGGTTVSLLCHGVGTGEARGRLVMRAGQQGAGERVKGTAVGRLVMRRSERSGGAVGRDERRKGKLTSGPRLSAAPGGR
jgi:hypothetical protein